jgi:hypothetical protein
MKITTTKNNITAAVRIVENAIAGGDDGNLSSHFLFRVVDGVLNILASNGKRLLASATVADATIEGEVKPFTVSAHRFGLLLKLSPESACTLDFDGSSTKVQVDGRTLRFASLDPSAFPYWDNAFTDAKETATPVAGRLFAALSYIKPFVSTMDTRTPALAATECREGTLWATDSQSLATTTVAGLEKASIRLHYSDIPPVNAFLGLDQDATVSIREHASTIFFVRADGGVFGVSRWTQEFPKLKLDRDTTKASFSVDAENFRYGLRFLSVASAKDDDRIRFEFKDSKVVLSVAAVAGGREEFTVETKAVVDITALSENGREGFDVNGDHISAILDTCTDDILTFGINWTAKNGYLLYKQMVDGDEYLAVVVWKK